MNDFKKDIRVVAETLVALHDDGVFSTYDPEIISSLEKTFGFNERELCNEIDDVLTERLEPRVEYASFGTYVKVSYKDKIYYFSGKNKCYYRESNWMDSMDAFYSADVIIDMKNGHMLKSRHHSTVDAFKSFFDKEFGFDNETY